MSQEAGFSFEVVKPIFENASAIGFSRVFAYSALTGVSGAVNVFLIFMAFSIGLTVDDGKVAV